MADKSSPKQEKKTRKKTETITEAPPLQQEKLHEELSPSRSHCNRRP